MRHTDEHAIVSMVPPMRGRFISYLRVSTDKQGERGYGLDAQRKAVTDYLNGGSWELLGEHVEVESGKRSDRPKLAEALAACKRHRAKLVIAKLDRLSRNVAFIATLMDGKVDFVCCDFPSANRLTLHILAAVAEHEREMIAKRTKEGLAAAKARRRQARQPGAGQGDGRGCSKAGRGIAAALMQMVGQSARSIAARLTEMGIAAPRGGAWCYKTVLRVMARLGL